MLSLSIDTRRIQSMLGNLADKQLRFATQAALNDIGFQVQRAELAAIPSIFASPRPFTQRSVQVNKATKALPVVTIFIRPEVAAYLAPYETGGQHVLPATQMLVPVDAKVDRYHQFRKGQIAQLAARPDVFWGEVHGVYGLWQRGKPARVTQVRGKRRATPAQPLKLLIIVRPNEPVTKHLDFVPRAQTLVGKVALKAMEDAVAKAIATAR